MASNEKLLPCCWCGSKGSSGDGFLPLESIEYAWCSNNDCPLAHGVDLGITPDEWNARAAPPVAVDGMPGRKRESNEDSDVLTDCHNEGWNACHDAFTAWLSKAVQGLPDPIAILKTHGVDAYSLGGSRIYKAFCDAFMPLVAQLGAENERLCESLTLEQDATAKWQEASIEIHNGKAEVYAERDALRAKVERLKDDALSLGCIVEECGKELGALRTTNAKLVGLLRRWSALDGGAWNLARYEQDEAELKRDTDALLASTGGGDH